MLNWITSRLGNSAPEVPSHPLGSDKAIEAFLAGLPGANPQRTLGELNEWLGDPTSLIDRLPVKQAARAVERIDEFAQDAVAGCWAALLLEAKANRTNQLAIGTLKAYFANSQACNRRILDLLAAESNLEQEPAKRQLAQFAARAMHNWGELKKLGRMNYLVAEPSWWTDVHALLRQARNLGLAHMALTVYPQHRLLSSVWREYQIGLLFETAPLTNLTVNEIDATDRLVRWIEPHCRFVDTPSPQTPFCINPDGGNMPARRQEDDDYGPDTRFFGIGQGQNQLAQLHAALVREQRLPEWLTASGCSLEQMQQLLQSLLANWSATPPNRRHPRLSAKGTIRVVNGLDMVRRMLAASEFARSGRDLDYDNYLKNFHTRYREQAALTAAPPPPPKTPMDVLRLLETAGDQQMMEPWEIIDVSRGGLGVRFAARRPWQRIGALVAYRMDDELDWHIGIIRRLGSSHGKPNAGLSCFGGTPACSQVRLASTLVAQDAWSQRTQETSGLGWHNAILLSTESRLILIPSGTFSPDHPIHLSVGGRWRSARLVKLQGRGNDYDLASYQEDEAPAA
ncbi:MAG: hypothetical protein H6R10_3737 [Rhodocyclaceae bacterium]|nr:hypothetical protein [Rhodocyclaceae bacterium]